MVFQVLSLVAAACVVGLAASVVIYRASNVAPVWSMVIAVLVVLLLAAAAVAILVFAKHRAFPN
jgi:hypothetical protein